MMALKADWVPFTYRSMNGTEAAKKETYTGCMKIPKVDSLQSFQLMKEEKAQN
jgi:hypothetical protein